MTEEQKESVKQTLVDGHHRVDALTAAKAVSPNRRSREPQPEFEQFWAQVKNKYGNWAQDVHPSFNKNFFRDIWRDIKMFEAQKIMAELGRT